MCNSPLLQSSTSESNTRCTKNFDRAMDAYRFAHGSPTTRFSILQKAMRETNSPSEVLAWLNLRAASATPRLNVSDHSKVYTPRLIRSPIALTRNEAAYLWSKHLPDPIAKAVGDNFYWRSWMTDAKTNWGAPAMLRLFISTAIRSVEDMLSGGTCMDLHVLEFLTAVLNVQSGVAPEWVRRQLSFLDGLTLKESSDTYRWRPFYHRVSIALLRLAASVIRRQSIRRTCPECAVFSKQQLSDQQVSWIHPSIVANVIAQSPPPQFTTTLAILEQRFALPMTENIMHAYLSCWALTELDFAAIINGFNHNLCLEECVMHAHQLYTMHMRCIAIPNTRFQHGVSFYALMIEVCYILGAVAEAWKIYRRAQLHTQLPSHTLYVLLDLRNHLPNAEKFIPSKEYVPFVQAVYEKLTHPTNTALFTPPEVLLCTRLCSEITTHRDNFLGKDSTMLSKLLEAFDRRLTLRIQTDIKDTRQSYLPVEETVVGFIESIYQLVSTQQCDKLCARLTSLLQRKGACAAILPAAMLLEAALGAGLNRQACSLYLDLSPSIRSGIVDNLKFKLLDMLFLVLQAEHHEAEANLLKNTLQKRRKMKPSHEQLQQIKENSASKEPYHIEVNFKQFMSSEGSDEKKGNEVNKYRLVYWR